MTRRRIALVRLLSGLLFSALAAPAGAGDLYWFGDGTNAGGTGNWSATGTNWSTSAMGSAGSMWDANSTAVFPSPSGTVSITDASISSAAGLRFPTGGYTVGGNTLNLSGTYPSYNTFDVVTLGQIATVNAVVAGSNGMAKAGAGTLVLGGNNTYTGETWIEGGTLSVNGVGAAVAPTARILAGNSSTGHFRVSGGASASFPNAYIGTNATAGSSSGTVTGSGSTLSITSDLDIGLDGASNTFTVSLGGMVTTANGFLGYNAPSDGNQVSVSGAGSMWSHSNLLEIGHLGSSNTFTVSAGGQASSAKDSVLGAIAGSTGNQLTVTGTGSKYSVATGYTLVVGDYGTANSVAVLAGGELTGYNARLGRQLGSDGNALTVAGAGSKWTNANTLRVGNKGSHNGVTVSAGGEVACAGDQYIGYDAIADDNSVTVTGANTKWTGGLVLVGLNGTNSVLTVCDHALFTASAVAVARNAGSSGTVNIGCGLAAGTVSALILFGNGDGELNFDHSDANYTFDKPIAGPGAVNQLGSGTTTITGPCSYSGGTTISAGTLRLGADDALPLNGPVTLAGGTLDANGHSAAMGELRVTADSTLAYGAGGAQVLMFASASYAGGRLLITGFDLEKDQFIISTNPASSGILSHIQFSGYPSGARWDPATGQIVPRTVGTVAPAPALSLGGMAAALGALAAIGLLALARQRRAG